MKMRIVLVTIFLLCLNSNSKIFAQEIFEESWETGLIDYAKWSRWGYPPSNILSYGFNSTFSLDPQGDGWCESGLTSIKTFSLPNTTLTFDIRNTTTQFAHQSARVGITSNTLMSGNCPEGGYYHLAMVDVNGDRNIMHARYYAPGGVFEEVIDKGWHNYEIQILPTGFVQFYRDGSLIYTSTQPIDFSIYSSQHITVNGRSVFGPVYIDNIAFSLNDQDIEVTPTSYDFGNVTWMGEPQISFINIANTGGEPLNITESTLTSPDSDFFITPLATTIIAPGESVDLEVMFSPTYLGYQSDTLQITSDDPDETLVEVMIGGVGVLSDNPSEQVSATIEYIETAIRSGDLVGLGNGNSADKKVKALTNMVEAFGDLLEDGLVEDGCTQLTDIYKKVDGKDSPPDFIGGDDIGTLRSVVEGMLIEHCSNLAPEQECYIDGQCASGVCEIRSGKTSGVCVEPSCSVDTDCGYQEFCDLSVAPNPACAPKLWPPSPCTDNNQCISGVCDENPITGEGSCS